MPVATARRQPADTTAHRLGKTGRFAVAARSLVQRRLKASLPSHRSRQGRQGCSLPVPEAFLAVGIKVETKRLSCWGTSGIISPRGQKGTHQIAVSRVAAAPQGRSCRLGAIRGKGKVCT